MINSTASTDPLGQIVDELVDELRQGASPSIEDFAGRYPEHAEEIREILPALVMLENAKADRDNGDSVLRGLGRPMSDEPLEFRHLGDYRIIREVGRGGMGVVYEAEQISLGRRVALKVLPFAAMLNGRSLQRFKNEAHAAALLQHTNIVPVHGVGCERGVHYYAMQYIEGQTLAKLIDDLQQHQAKLPGNRRSEEVDPFDISTTTRNARAERTPLGGSKVSPHCLGQRPTTTKTSANGDGLRQAGLSTSQGTHSAEYFRSVAQLFIQVAEALHHAHQEGVVHRDVKPSNLILDSQGKVWVTDFGLAQVESSPALTMTGDLVGTLRYMSPEQALVKRLIVDHRTDIYSLGATLYELLTLQPIFAGATRQELLRRIACEEPRPPRQLDKAIPVELETIVLKAMAKDPQERYANAEEVAEDLRCHLADKPIRAKRPTLLQRAAKWSRRHRGLVASAATMLLLVVVGLAIGTTLIWRAKGQTQAALAQAQENLKTAQQHRMLARQRAEQQEAVVRFLVKDLLGAARPEITLGQKTTVEDVLKNAEAKIATAFPQQPLVEATVRQTMGVTYLKLGLLQAAERHLARARQLRTMNLGVYHHATLNTVNDLAILRKEQGRYAEARTLHEKVLAGRRRGQGEEHPQTLTSMSNLANILLALGEFREARKIHELTLTRRQRVLGDNHSDTLTSRINLGVVLQRQGEYEPARQQYEQAMQAFRRTRGNKHPQTMLAMNNLGCILRLQGRWEDARQLHDDVLQLQRRVLGDEHPHTLASMINLGLVLRKLGQWEDALELQEQAVKVQIRVLGDNHRDTLRSQGNLAMLYSHQRQPIWARKLCEQVLAAQRRILGDQNADTLKSMNNLAFILRAIGDVEGARGLHEKTLAARRRVLGNEHPQTLSSMNNLAITLSGLGQLDAACDLHRETLAARRRVLGDGHPQTRASIAALARVCNLLGIQLRKQNRPKEAEAVYLESLVHREKLARDHPREVRYLSNLGGTLHNLGGVLHEQGKLTQAAARFERAIKLQRYARESDPNNATYRLFLRNHYVGYSETLILMKDHARAAAASQELAELDTRGMECYWAATLLARCIALAEQDERLGAQKLYELVESYGAQAVELLNRSMSKGHRLEQLRSNDVFATLRSRGDFQRLVAELDAIASPAREQ